MIEADRPRLPNGILNASIMIVDDVELNRLTLRQILARQGFRNFVEAADGESAMRTALDRPPHLIILDLMMPRLDGFTFCRQARQEPKLRHLPILVQTALTDNADRTRAFHAGATDLISKPINAEELIARAIIQLEYHALLGSLQQYKLDMDHELSQARDLQGTLLPSGEHIETLEASHGIRVHSHFEPSIQIGGDVWGVWPIDESKVSVYTIDLSGHGVSAALNTFRLHTLIRAAGPAMRANPGAFLTSLNGHLCNMFSRQQFATMFYGVVNLQANKLFYAAAASPSAVMVSGTEISTVSGQGFPLGIVKDAVYDTQSLPFRKSDRLMLFSDALTEVESHTQGVLGEDRLVNSLRSLPEKDGKTLFNHALEQYRQYLGHGNLPQDDLTLTVYERLA